MIRRYTLVAVLPILLLGLSGRQVHAQQGTPVSNAVPVDLPLSIAPPPEGKVTLEVDARDNDLLGVVKELIRSLNGTAGKSASTPGGVAAAESAKSQDPPPTPSGKGNDFFEMIQQLNLDEIIKGITHLHVITIELTNPVSANANRVLEVKPDLIGYYEKSFQKEENRRVLWSDKDNTRILMMASDIPRRNFSVVIQSGKNVTIVRADGYPNVEKLTKVFGLFN